MNIKIKEVALINDEVMYMLDNIECKINEREIEGKSYAGVTAITKGILTYPEHYPEGAKYIWLKYIKITFTDANIKERRKITNKIQLFFH